MCIINFSKIPRLELLHSYIPLRRTIVSQSDLCCYRRVWSDRPEAVPSPWACRSSSSERKRPCRWTTTDRWAMEYPSLWGWWTWPERSAPPHRRTRNVYLCSRWEMLTSTGWSRRCFCRSTYSSRIAWRWSEAEAARERWRTTWSRLALSSGSSDTLWPHWTWTVGRPRQVCWSTLRRPLCSGPWLWVYPRISSRLWRDRALATPSWWRAVLRECSRILWACRAEAGCGIS